MIHLLAKEYGWGKSQINEVYPEEASVLLRFIALDRQDKQLQEKIDHYTSNLETLFIHHGDPDKVKEDTISTITRLQKLAGIESTDSNYSPQDDDIPDFERLDQLKNFQKTRR